MKKENDKNLNNVKIIIYLFQLLSRKIKIYNIFFGILNYFNY